MPLHTPGVYIARTCFPDGTCIFYYLDKTEYYFYKVLFITSSNQHITPLYQADNGLYEYNLVLTWCITGPDEDSTLLINILYIDIDESDSNCRDDFLSVSPEQFACRTI